LFKSAVCFLLADDVDLVILFILKIMQFIGEYFKNSILLLCVILTFNLCSHSIYRAHNILKVGSILNMGGKTGIISETMNSNELF